MIPLIEPTSATDALLLTQMPAGIVSFRYPRPPIQKELPPVIAVGVSLIVNVSVAEQPPGMI
jgi:hypothetical protein